VRVAVGGDLHKVHFHGCAVLGGWGSTSDVDMLVLVQPPANQDWARLAEALAASCSPLALEL
jgi:hypothetical protein